MSENHDIYDDEQTFPDENSQNGDPENPENLTEEKSAQEVLAEEKDRYIRLYAEFENYKKRTAKERMEFFQYANQDMMISMLEILDDFERAIKEIAKTENETDLKGVELIYQKFKNKLAEKGLKPIEVNIGDDFNVDFHEAITQIPAPSEDLKGKIVDVIETGYQLYDKVIRFSKVIIGN
ncbi:MAG: nucleotide exchange factor GrpE [Flavobacteriaceae bacterium]|jgi:molecular chaperone GrpE|nr:nucleotide exchange factor GrpE [Flavobacteriaceae bacterium]